MGMMAAGIVLPSFPTCHNSPNRSSRNESTSLHLLSSCCSLSPLSHALSATTAARKMCFSSPCRQPNRSMQQRSESISLCTNADEVDAVELSALLAATRQNCEQFPAVLNDGSIAPVDPVKLRRALRHSTVVVALYVEGPETSGAESNGKFSAEEELDGRPSGRGWLDSWMLQPRGQKTLVAFGRATSDHELTASIYDLAVAPSYQRSGFGSRVLLTIVRGLRRRGISDIAATSPPELRPFFEHCGFGPDTLKSVTMMYTRSPSGATESWRIKEHGRKSLLIPPPLKAMTFAEVVARC